MKNKITNANVRKWFSSAKYKSELVDTEMNDFKIRRNKTDASYLVFYRNSNGRRLSYTIGKYPSITPIEAREIAKDKFADIAKGLDIQADKQKVRHTETYTVLSYLNNIYKPSKLNGQKSGQATYKSIENSFKSMLGIQLTEITSQQILQWQAARRGKGLNHQTNKRVYGAFKTMLNHAAKHGFIEKNPLEKINLSPEYETTEQIQERDEKRTYLEKYQMQDFLQAMDIYQQQIREQRRNSRAHGKPYLSCLDDVVLVDRTKPMLLTMFYTGFRNGDVISLKWEEVNLDFGVITKVLEKGAHIKQTPLKISMPVELKEILNTWHIQQGRPNKGYVFINEKTNTKYGKGALTAPFNKIKKLAGLPDELQPYTLRHNFISWLVMEGKDLLTITKLTGHTTVDMIVKHYGHLQPQLLDDAVNSFAALSRGGCKTQERHTGN
jgi:integrase